MATATLHDDASRCEGQGVLGRRFVGAAAGVAVSLLVTLLPPELQVSVYRMGPTLGLMGAPAAALVGWVGAPSVWHGGASHVVVRGLAVGLAVVPLGVLTILATELAAELVRGRSTPAELLVVSFMFATYGLVFGAVVLPITLPSGVAWAAAVRAVAALESRARRNRGDQRPATSASA